MRLESVAEGATRSARWFAIALGASIPVSTALDNILMALTLAAWVLSGLVLVTAKILFKNKCLWFSTLLFIMLALGTLYGESPRSEAFSTLGKYADLICIPIFAILFQQRETRFKALHAFAISIALVVTLSYLIRWGVLPTLPFINGDAISPTVFKQKITHNILLAFGSFLFLWLGFISTNWHQRVIWYSFALLAALNVVFLVKGATGYLTLGALIVLLGWERLRWRGTVYGALGLLTFLATLAMVPGPSRERLTLIQQEVQQWQVNKAAKIDSSTGLRLEFYHNTMQMIAAHPLSGVGTGGFPRAYAKQVEGSGKIATRNPHNEFLLIAAQIGMLGLVVLLAMLWQQWRAADKLDTPMDQALARALVLTLATGCLVNSLLLDHTEGVFYAWLSGLLYGGLIHRQPETAFLQK